MSVAGPYLKLDEALRVGERVANELAPHVKRIKAVGSLRRQKATVNDIEFLVEPKPQPALLDDVAQPDVESIKGALRTMGTWVKGGERFMQITNLFGIRGRTLEIYLCHPPAQFGSLLAIRTGPYELGRFAMMALSKRGYTHIDGHVIENATGNVVPTPEEEDFFRLAGIPHWKPAHREDLYTRLAAGERLVVEVG